MKSEDIITIVMNALDMPCDYDAQYAFDSRINGILISIDGRYHDPWGISYKTNAIKDELIKAIWHGTEGTSYWPNVEGEKANILDNLLDRFIDYISMEVGATDQYALDYHIDVCDALQDLANITKLAMTNKKEYANKMKDAQIRARRNGYFDPTTIFMEYV